MKKLVLQFFCFASFLMANAQEGKSANGYRGYVDLAIGDAYNLNTARTISTNNMQWHGMVSTTHGYRFKNWFVGGGAGYYHSFRDKETMYPIYAAGRYTFDNGRTKPFVEARAGVIYDPLWVETVQKYGALSVGMKVYKGLHIGLGGSIFSRPSRYFTANAAVVLSYGFGK